MNHWPAFTEAIERQRRINRAEHARVSRCMNEREIEVRIAKLYQRAKKAKGKTNCQTAIARIHDCMQAVRAFELEQTPDRLSDVRKTLEEAMKLATDNLTGSKLANCRRYIEIAENDVYRIEQAMHLLGAA
jgi:hypothetical protein